MTEAALKQLEVFVNNQLSLKDRLVVLEAGCGSATYIKFQPVCFFIGIDISSQQLERNSMLDIKIQGDIQYYVFSPDTFDVVICWNVLEHLLNPELALKNFTLTLKQGGLLILSIPNLYSIKGVMTKFTPHWFHVLIHRHGYGFTNAGKSDCPPYKTYLRNTISLGQIKSMAEDNGMEIVYTAIYGDDYLRSSNLALKNAYRLVDKLARAITFGHLGESEIHLVLAKR